MGGTSSLKSLKSEEKKVVKNFNLPIWSGRLFILSEYTGLAGLL